MVDYRLISLDMTPDGEINDAHDTGIIMNLPENPSVQDICDGLKSVERMAPDWPVNKVGADWSDDNGDVYVLNADGKKIYLLQPIRLLS